jgi:putative flippase GtrA
LSTIRDLYMRFRQLIHEGFKFLVVGAIGTIVTFAVANGLHSMGKYKAVTIATIIATVVTYLGNRYWSFSHRQGQGTARESVIFLVLNGVGLLIYYGCIWLIQDVAGLPGKGWYNLALVVGTGLGTLFRFWSYRKWVWKAVEHPGSGALAAGADGPAPAAPGEDLPARPATAGGLPADGAVGTQVNDGTQHGATAARR